MKNQPLEIQVNFTCQHCGQKIEVRLGAEPMSMVCCSQCYKTFTVMRPAISEEILIDWENEAQFQKIRAEKTESSNNSLLALIIRVIELLTWRDKGNGQVEAIKEMRGWLIENESVSPMEELFQVEGRKRMNWRNFRK
ncbi:hypothetical protein [Paenibacillus sp. GCM10012306]|uniref:hypothetical protein n=1 Tax=Paenibacillus sp. GCM10012306 TaxID=3317342 RepID=UPI0036227655